MRKLFVIVWLIVISGAAANAQWFVGGNIHFSETSSRTETTYTTAYYGSEQIEANPVTTAFGIMPRVGYMFNDRWLAGLGVGYEFQKQSPYGPSEVTVRSNAIAVSPFVRCNMLWFGPFMLGLEASGTFSSATLKDDQQWDRQDHTLRRYGGQISPVLEVDVSKNVSLECRLNFLSIGYYHTREIAILEREGEMYRHESSSNHATGIFSGDELFRLGDLTFGVVYKF